MGRNRDFLLGYSARNEFPGGKHMFDKRSESKQGTGPTQEPAPPAPGASAPLGRAAVIGQGITINGDISGTESLVIEGKVEGKISLPGHQVEVGKAGRVNADIQARMIKVEGELKGDIEGKEKVVIARSGNVRGNIKAPRVSLEDGAIFKGSIDIDPTGTAPVELPLGGQKPVDNVKSLSGEAAGKESVTTVKGS